jgi:phosphoribosylaminoimidazole carboxylase (NCAIR synthetase)
MLPSVRFVTGARHYNVATVRTAPHYRKATRRTRALVRERLDIARRKCLRTIRELHIRRSHRATSHPGPRPLTNVVFVAPIFSPAATQMIEAAASLPDVRLAVIAQQPFESLAPHIGARLAGHWRIDDITDAHQLEKAILALSERIGKIDRCFGAYEQLQEPLAKVREKLGIPGLSSEAAANFRDKGRMKDALRKAGIPVARHVVATRERQLHDFVTDVGFPIVVKPPSGAGAIATHRVANQTSLDELLSSQTPTESSPWLAEEFLKGTEHSMETVSINGQAVWHSLTRYEPSPLEVLEHPWIQWCVVLPREIDDPSFDDARKVVADALKVLGMQTGVSHSEWFRREDGSVAISEIAARPPGAQITTLVSRAHDIDFVKAWARLMIFGAFDVPARKFAVGAAYLRGQGSGHVRGVYGLDIVEREFGALICDFRLPYPGQTPSGSYEGEGYILLRHRDTNMVVSALRRLISVVRVTLG